MTVPCRPIWPRPWPCEYVPQDHLRQPEEERLIVAHLEGAEEESRVWHAR